MNGFNLKVNNFNYFFKHSFVITANKKYISSQYSCGILSKRKYTFFFLKKFHKNSISLNQLFIEDVANHACRVKSITKSDNIIIMRIVVKNPLFTNLQNFTVF